MIRALQALLGSRGEPLHIELYLPARQRLTVVVGTSADRPVDQKQEDLR